MLKYTDTEVVLREIPDEVTLAINISNCPCQCKGCHSPYLSEDVGQTLLMSRLLHLCDSNKGITCVSFMGGDSAPEDVNFLASVIRMHMPELKIAWYSGRQELSKYIELKNFDYIKLGPYKEELGPLDKETTNQRLYKVSNNELGVCISDITSKFWKKN